VLLLSERRTDCVKGAPLNQSEESRRKELGDLRTRLSVSAYSGTKERSLIHVLRKNVFWWGSGIGRVPGEETYGRDQTHSIEHRGEGTK